jgi:hypothetical protein
LRKEVLEIRKKESKGKKYELDTKSKMWRDALTAINITKAIKNKIKSLSSICHLVEDDTNTKRKKRHKRTENIKVKGKLEGKRK